VVTRFDKLTAGFENLRACPERCSSFDVLRTNGVEGVTGTGLATPKPEEPRKEAWKNGF
jgi:hypothetical protein